MPHCCFGGCNSDSRFGRPGYDETVKFYRFPQPCLQLRDNVLVWTDSQEKHHLGSCKKCQISWKWLVKSNRRDPKFLSIRSVSKNFTICSKHFEEPPAVMDYEKYTPTPAARSVKEYPADVDNMRRKSQDMDYDIDSSEDTQEASEVEQRPVSPPPKKENRHHRSSRDLKMDELRQELQDLMSGRHPEYLSRCRQLELDLERRHQLNSLYRDHAIELAEKEYVEEKKAAQVDYDDKSELLKTNLIQFLEDKRRIIESDYQTTMELNVGDISETKLPTRNLRRRALDSTPAQEKRRGKISTAPCQIQHQLDEKDIDDDLRAIARARRTASLGVNGIQTLGPFPPSVNPSDIKIEDGKLLYEKKWFHRGQTVFVEGRHMAKFPAVICNIGTESIHVKRVADSTKVRVSLNNLMKGSITIKRRAS
ncbi:hypothetical protein GE061_001959 [Apolygus lucorum]|uniref:THAP-type domain-containing protein n=1 Tax=Apolygus lucorum TaxID=248454 RepID=A0A8S9X3T0_APOLU|nr:hypothetical protein GE061_001959 [Apolygus lucorum]